MLRFGNDTFLWCREGEEAERLGRLLQTPTFAAHGLDRRLSGTITGHAEVDLCVKIDLAGPTKEFIDACVAKNVMPYVAQNTSGTKSAVPHEIARTEGDAMSQRKCNLTENRAENAANAPDL